MLHQNMGECQSDNRKLIEAFTKYVLDAFGLSDVKMDSKLVTLIGRRPYFAHPRAKFISGNVERHIENEVTCVVCGCQCDGVGTEKSVDVYGSMPYTVACAVRGATLGACALCFNGRER